MPLPLRDLTCLALVLFLSTARAEAQSGHMKLRRFNRAPEPVQIDLATGAITRGAPPRPRSAGTVSDFPNMDLSGFYGVDSGGGIVKAAVWGDKGIHANASDLVNDITFAYGSAMLDPSLGGPGGSVRLDFYEGRLDTSATTAVAVYTLTGLPANSASSSFFGGFTTYVANVKPPELL